MAMFIAFGIVLGIIFAGRTFGRVRETRSFTKLSIPPKVIAQINLLLQNIETYEGTAKGKKRLEVKK